MNIETILAAIGSTEETSFSEFCSALGDDCPEAGDKGGWREVFGLIREGERLQWIEVSKSGNRINNMILTEAGANRIRDRKDAERPLLSYTKD